MTRLRNMTRTAAGAGCQITGCFYRADGRPLVGVVLRFTPARSGMWQGRVIGRAPVETLTDANGRFTLRLAPSDVLGRYEVVAGETRYVVDVPDQPAAAFEDIAVAA